MKLAVSLGSFNSLLTSWIGLGLIELHIPFYLVSHKEISLQVNSDASMKLLYFLWLLMTSDTTRVILYTLARDNEYLHVNKQMSSFNILSTCALAFLLLCHLPKDSQIMALKIMGKPSFNKLPFK